MGYTKIEEDFEKGEGKRKGGKEKGKEPLRMSSRLCVNAAASRWFESWCPCFHMPGHTLNRAKEMEKGEFDPDVLQALEEESGSVGNMGIREGGSMVPGSGEDEEEDARGTI